MLTLVLLRHEAYVTGRYDLGNMAQAVWNTAHGHPLELTFQNGEQTIRLAAHADIFLVFLAPFALVFPVAIVLLVVQTAALALGALPVFWLARKHVRSDLGAVCLVLAYLLYPWVAWAAMGDFHSVTVAVCLLLFAIWALDEDRLWLFSAFAFVAVTTHELVGVHIAALGIWYAVARGRRRAGIVIAAAGTAWTALFVGLVIPLAADGENVFYGRFESVGGSPSGVVRMLLDDPGRVLGTVTNGDDYVYLILLLVPLGLLSVYAPGLLFVAAPQLSVNLLSDWYASTSPKYHYTSVIVPFVVGATILGVARFSPGRARGAVLALIASVAFFVAVGPRPGPFLDAIDARAGESLRQAADLIPSDAAVSASEGLGGRLSERRVIYSFPMIRDADWVIVDRRDPWLPDLPNLRRGWRPEEYASAVRRLERDPRFRQVFNRDGVLVYRRIASVVS
jgi:uncharacterized membrane protein